MIDITIAIPVYNVEKYVEKSLLSALNQDFSGSYEILVVDDKGTDKSMDIVRRVIENHKKGNIVRIVEHPENKGLGPARNTAINEAKGKYLFFLDSDDWITENCLKVLYGKAAETNAQVTVGSVCRVNEVTGECKYNLYPNQFVNHQAAGVYMHLNHIEMNIEVWNKLFDLDFLRKNKICCVHRIIEDSIFDFNLRALAERIVLIPDVTLYYNVRESSILTSIFGKTGSHESAYVFCDIIKHCQNLIRTKYSNIEGIYDLYCLRIDFSFSSLIRSQYSKEDMLLIKDGFRGLNSFIPNNRVLKMKKNKILNILLRLGDNYEHRKRLFFLVKYINVLRNKFSYIFCF